MKNKVLFVVFLIATHATVVLGQTGIEQYYYWEEEKPITLVPIVHVQGARSWYGEARYNYEELGTFSLYAGRNFSKEYKRFSYSLTPIAGAVVGKLKGGSFGLNATLEFGDLFFSSQSQYTFCPSTNSENFLFSWAEVGYEPIKWFYFGFSVQHTYYSRQDVTVLQHGGMIGFTAERWSFPVYGFNLLDASRYFVLGINLGLGTKNSDN